MYGGWPSKRGVWHELVGVVDCKGRLSEQVDLIMMVPVTRKGSATTICGKLFLISSVRIVFELSMQRYNMSSGEKQGTEAFNESQH